MNDFIETRSPEEFAELLMQLRAENDTLREQVNSLVSSLAGVADAVEERDSLRLEVVELREQLGVKTSVLEQVEAEFSALTNSARLVVEDRDRLREKNEELQASVNRLTNMLWGRRSEKRSDPNHPTLFDLQLTADELAAERQRIVAAEIQLDAASQQQALDDLLARRKRKKLERLGKGGREQFPAHLERRASVLDLSDEAKQGLVLLRVDVIERLRFEKPQVYVEVIRRHIYVKPGDPDAGVMAPPAPVAIQPGVKYGFDVIAAMVSLKMGFHQPTYRQQTFFAQAGYFPSRSTINDLLNYSEIVIDPLFQEKFRLLLQQTILLGDDTQIRLLTRQALSNEELEKLSKRASRQSGERAPPGSATSYAWLYMGLDGMAPYNIFHWSLTREDTWIDTHLAGFHGIFVGDATGPNVRLGMRSGGRIIHAACNAHARRGFVAAEKTHPIEAAKALAFYQRLAAIEARCLGLSAQERLAVRRQESLPIWLSFRQWIDSDELKGVLPKSPLGKALEYVKKHDVALARYLDDGRLPFDNNQSEQTIRPLVIGRKNWIFLGHPQAAAGRLKLFSMVSSAHRHHLIVEDYLADVLYKLAYAQQLEPHLLLPGSVYLQSLLPDHWALANPKSVCQERREEAESVAERKLIRTLKRKLAVPATIAAGNQETRSSSTAAPAVSAN